MGYWQDKSADFKFFVVISLNPMAEWCDTTSTVQLSENWKTSISVKIVYMHVY